MVGLAHEIQHAFEMDAGKYNATKVFCQKNKIVFADNFTDYLPFCGNAICEDLRAAFDEIIVRKEIEKGEYSAIQTANKVYKNLGGTKMMARINGYTIDQLR